MHFCSQNRGDELACLPIIFVIGFHIWYVASREEQTAFICCFFCTLRPTDTHKMHTWQRNGDVDIVRTASSSAYKGDVEDTQTKMSACSQSSPRSFEIHNSTIFWNIQLKWPLAASAASSVFPLSLCSSPQTRLLTMLKTIHYQLKLLKAPVTKPPDFQGTSPIKIVINKIF